MIKILGSLALSCIIMTNLSAQSADEKEVAAAVEKLRLAMISAVKSDLESIASANLTYGHSNGLVEDKAAFVQNIVSHNSVFLTIELSEQVVKISGNVATVRHKLVSDTNNNNVPGKANIGVLLVWAKEKGGWKLLARQAYKL